MLSFAPSLTHFMNTLLKKTRHFHISQTIPSFYDISCYSHDPTKRIFFSLRLYTQVKLENLYAWQFLDYAIELTDLYYKYIIIYNSPF